MARDRERIRELNDQVRTAGPMAGDHVLWLTTPGVNQLGPAAIVVAIQRVQTFDRFNDGNDPHGEHDFGSFDLDGERLFWKIDYYDPSLSGGSENPADEAATCRVITIMLALEY